MNTKNIKFDLIANARDSLSHAVGHLTNDHIPNAGDYKRVIIDLSHVVELILKERLVRVHEAFVFTNIDDYPPKKNIKTVTPIQALSRLERIAKIILSINSRKTIERCFNLRNSIIHFKFDVSEQETKVIIGRILALIFDFSRNHLSIDFETEFREDDRWEALLDIYEFWEAQSDSVEKRLIEEKKPCCECPMCVANTFDLSAMKCALCNHSDDQVECDQCKKFVWESEIEVLEGEDIGLKKNQRLNLCQDCMFPEPSEDFLKEAKASYQDYLDNNR